tara:strand:+ start:7535 stop:8482 length:948 start_codon:yes stop_codon:yes gene_type:complete
MAKKLILKAVRRFYKEIFAESKVPPHTDLKGEEVANYIAKKIEEGGPFFVARLGANEFNCISGYVQGKKKGLSKYKKYITSELDCYDLNDEIITQTYECAGVFPPTNTIFEKFAELSLNDLKDVDMLGVWLKEDNLLKKQLATKIRIPLKDIEPYYHEHPWSKALAGKDVLVIHPFAKSILSQYGKQALLFQNKDTLPKFNLKVIQSVQSIAGQPTPFLDWFEALEHMKNEIDNTKFDIAIIGCGAYGLSLGAHIKRTGKQAIHMGGATQLLFGIRGKRWDEHPTISKMYNEHWIRPLSEETPKDKNKVEDGCYW